MKPACWLCGGECETLRQARWNLPHLAAEQIGFGLCTHCGLVQQTSSVSPQEMARYYRESAVYTNPGRAGQPSAGKVRGVQQALNMVADGLGRPAGSVFQVGSSDGYTLSQFQLAGAESVGGIEPSAASCEHARTHYGVDAIVGSAEDIELPRGIELWVLTHVLEHLYDPLTMMRRVREAQNRSDWVLIEVPLFEQVHRFPLTYLTFEHLTYFSESTLLQLLDRAGYTTEQVQKSYSEDLYPIIRVLARAGDPADAPERDRSHEVAIARELLSSHVERERRSWMGVQARFEAALDPGTRAWLWGAGIHSSQLLAYTNVEDYLNIEGLLDSSPIRHGQEFGNYRIADPAAVDLRDGSAVVISSHAAEAEIWNALAPERAAGVPVVGLYGAVDDQRSKGSLNLEAV